MKVYNVVYKTDDPILTITLGEFPTEFHAKWFYNGYLKGFTDLEADNVSCETILKSKGYADEFKQGYVMGSYYENHIDPENLVILPWYKQNFATNAPYNE